MKIFFDTEFYEHDERIQLISLGAVREDGKEYYAELNTFRWSQVPPKHWLQANVRPHLWSQMDDKREGNRWSRDGGEGGLLNDRDFRNTFLRFVGPKPEFWAWYGDYDWVVLCQKYGSMIELPKSWPQYALDFRQVVHERGLIVQRAEDMGFTAHNALEDARWLYTIAKDIV